MHNKKHIPNLISYLDKSVSASATAAGPIRLDGRLPPFLPPPSSQVKSIAWKHGGVAQGRQTIGMVTVVETEGAGGGALDQTVQAPVTRLQR